MGQAVVRQRNPRLISGQTHAVDLGMDDTAAHAARVLDLYVVTGSVVTEHYSEASPCSWYAWLDEQGCSLQTESENPFEAGPVHPSGRAGVPSPSAASDMGGRGIEIGAGDVGLDLV